jgi:hypothetical protein
MLRWRRTLGCVGWQEVGTYCRNGPALCDSVAWRVTSKLPPRAVAAYKAALVPSAYQPLVSLSCVFLARQQSCAVVPSRALLSQLPLCLATFTLTRAVTACQATLEPSAHEPLVSLACVFRACTTPSRKPQGVAVVPL